MINRIRELFRKNDRLRELASYVFFGGLTTLVNWLSYFLLTQWLGLRGLTEGTVQYHTIATVANSLAWLISVVFAFITNKRYVFESKEKRAGAWREFLLFVGARGLSYLLFDLLLFNLLLSFMGDLPTKLITNLLVILFNYFASKWVIFRKSKKG